MSTSPPTDRVLGIVDLLVRLGEPATASEVSRRVDQSRSTCAAILESLARHGWAERLDDGRYHLGGRLIALASMVRAQNPVLTGAADVLGRLSRDTGRASTLTHYTRSFGTIAMSVSVPDLCVTEHQGPSWSFRVVPPLGAVVMAWEDRSVADAWLGGIPDPPAQRALVAFQEAVRARGVGVWRLDDPDAGLSQFLALLRTVGPRASRPPTAPSSAGGTVGTAGADPLGRMLEVLGIQLAPFGYTAAEVADPPPHLAVSYLTAPVLDGEGRPRYEVTLIVLEPRLARRSLDRLIDRTREAATELTRLADPTRSQA